MNSLLKDYIKLYNEMKNNNTNCIPLCAAETYISEFVKQPLNSELRFHVFQGI